jgi:LmbE family N-acetylglucosaminyl deacetylase
VLDLSFDHKHRALRVLCIGAHCDDIEIGCGATLRMLQDRYRRVTIDWIVLCGSDKRRKETQAAMSLLVRRMCRGKLQFGDFPDGRFPAAYSEMKDYFESLKDSVPVDVILTHERADRHQDHRIANEMAWGAFRDHIILEYEIPKWDGGLGQPNVYVPVSRRNVNAKIDALMRAYRTQTRKDWFTRDAFMSLLRLRGLECRSPSGYAEAFHGRKLRLCAS